MFNPIIFRNLAFPLLVFPAAVSAVSGQVPPEQVIVVTPARTAQVAEKTIAAVTVIDRLEIERSQAVTVADLLEGVPGLTLTRNGGAGKIASVFLRGSESDHVVVLVDGVRMGSATSGTFSFADLPTSMIERIEVVRGPRSSLYGADAIGGVIQIFTRRSGDTLVEIKAGAGNRDTQHHALTAAAGRVWFAQGTVEFYETEGFNACQPEAATLFGGCFADEPDDDGYRNRSGQIQLGYMPVVGRRIAIGGFFTEADNEFDGFVNESEFQQNLINVNADWRWNESHDSTFVVGRSEDKRDSFSNGTFSSRFETLQDSASLIHDWNWNPEQTLTLGTDYRREEIDTGSQAFVETERENIAGFIQWQRNAEVTEIKLSIRLDDNSRFSNSWTGNVGGGVWLNPSLKGVASYGTAFKAPSFNELYFPGFGNPDLEPEEAESAEVGLKYQSGDDVAAIHTFWSQTEDLIAFDPIAFIPVNIGKAKVKGLEAFWERKVERWRYGASFTLTHSENLDSANRGNQLPRRPVRSFKGWLSYDASQWGGSLDLLANGRSWDDPANQREIGAWQTVDLATWYAPTPDIKINLKLENLFDTEYESAAFYNEAPFTFMLSVKYQWKPTGGR